MLSVQKGLEQLEKQFLSAEGDADDAHIWQLGEHMTHTYYLDQLEAIRPTWQMIFNLIMVLMICLFVIGGLMVMRDKNIIHNFHEQWTI